MIQQRPEGLQDVDVSWFFIISLIFKSMREIRNILARTSSLFKYILTMKWFLDKIEIDRQWRCRKVLVEDCRRDKRMEDGDGDGHGTMLREDREKGDWFTQRPFGNLHSPHSIKWIKNLGNMYVGFKELHFHQLSIRLRIFWWLVFTIPHIGHGRHGQRWCKFFWPV